MNIRTMLSVKSVESAVTVPMAVCKIFQVVLMVVSLFLETDIEVSPDAVAIPDKQ